MWLQKGCYPFMQYTGRQVGSFNCIPVILQITNSFDLAYFHFHELVGKPVPWKWHLSAHFWIYVFLFSTIKKKFYKKIKKNWKKLGFLRWYVVCLEWVNCSNKSIRNMQSKMGFWNFFVIHFLTVSSP